MLDHPNSFGHGLHNVDIGHLLGGVPEATYTTAHRAAAVAEKFNVPPWRASSLILVGWTTETGAGVADAVRLIDAEIANATAVGPLPQYYLGLAAEVLPPDDQRTRLVMSVARLPGSTRQASASICLRSIACRRVLAGS